MKKLVSLCPTNKLTCGVLELKTLKKEKKNAQLKRWTSKKRHQIQQHVKC